MCLTSFFIILGFPIEMYKCLELPTPCQEQLIVFICPEPEDDNEDHLPRTLTQTLTVVNCICAAVLIRTFPDISNSAELDSLENH